MAWRRVLARVSGSVSFAVWRARHAGGLLASVASVCTSRCYAVYGVGISVCC